MCFKNKNVLIIGSGVSGKGAEFALTKSGASCYILDEKNNKSLLTQKFVSEFNLVVVSPAIELSHKIYILAKNAKIEVISEPELGARLFSGRVIGITGTNGKTTVTQLLGSMLINAGFKTAVCGNVGYSFARASVETDAEYAAVELSSFQLEQMGTHLKPEIAMILNISPDHLDRHGTMDNYAASKKNIALNQDENDTLILSFDDIPIKYLDEFSPKSKVIFVSVKGQVGGAYLLNGVLYYDHEPIVKQEDIKIKGLHNVSNALFCTAAAKILGVGNEVIRDTLSSFCPDSHRISLVATIKGKNYYNDSKGTNMGASLAACSTMVGDTALILGGKDKGYDFDNLFINLPHNIRHIYAIGETAKKIEASAEKIGFNSIECTNLENAVKNSISLNVANVLLSPACSSFDAFKDYKDRGEYFEKLVKGLE